MDARIRPSAPLPTTRVTRAREQAWQVVRTKARLIVLTTLAVMTLATVYILQVRSHYIAAAEIMLDPRKSSVGNSTDVLSNLTVDQPTILNQIEILTSHRFSSDVVDRLHLDGDPEFSHPGFADRLFETRIDRRQLAIDTLRKRLKVSQAGFSSTIRVTVDAGDRQKASVIAATIATMYVQQQVQTKSEASRRASGWLTERVTELAQKVKDAEAAVQKYKADHRITITAAGTSVIEQQVTDLSSQLTVARTDYDDKAAKADRTAALVKAGQIASSPQSVASPLIVTLRTQQSELSREIANLSTRYGPNHPKIVELTAQRATLEAKIALENQRIADSVRNDAETSRSHVASLQSNLHQIEDLNARKNQDAVELVALQSVAASARAMYQAFLTQYSQTENQQGIIRPDAYVISASEVEDSFGPQTKLLAILSSIPAGLFLGLALAFATGRNEAIEPVVAPSRIPRDKFPVQSLPELGATAQAADLVITSPHSAFSKAVSGIFADVTAATQLPATIVVTSATPQAGKTTLSLALARAAAQVGLKTILVDANGSASHLDRLIGSPGPLWPGYVPAKGRMENFIVPDPLSPTLVMAPNPAYSGYSEFVSGPVLARLVTNLSRDFDFIVINAPLLSDVGTASVVALGNHVVVAMDARRPLPAINGHLPKSSTAVLTHS